MRHTNLSSTGGFMSKALCMRPFWMNGQPDNDRWVTKLPEIWPDPSQPVVGQLVRAAIRDIMSLSLVLSPLPKGIDPARFAGLLLFATGNANAGL